MNTGASGSSISRPDARAAFLVQIAGLDPAQAARARALGDRVADDPRFGERAHVALALLARAAARVPDEVPDEVLLLCLARFLQDHGAEAGRALYGRAYALRGPPALDPLASVLLGEALGETLRRRGPAREVARGGERFRFDGAGGQGAS